MKSIKWKGTEPCAIRRGRFQFQPGEVREVPDEVAELFKDNPDWEIMNEESRDESRTETKKTKRKKAKEE